MKRPLYSEMLFPQVEQELKAHPEYASDVTGFFTINIFNKGKLANTWYVISKGRKLVEDPESEDFRKQAASTQPTSVRLSRQQPTKQEVAGLPVVKFELEDRVLLKMITGGMNGIKAYTTKKLKIEGDLRLARSIERVFVRAGGVEKVMRFIRTKYPDSKL